MPDRSDSDLCNASNIRLMFTRSGCSSCPWFAVARLQFLQIVVQQEKGFCCSPRVAFLVTVSAAPPWVDGLHRGGNLQRYPR